MKADRLLYGILVIISAQYGCNKIEPHEYQQTITGSWSVHRSDDILVFHENGSFDSAQGYPNGTWSLIGENLYTFYKSEVSRIYYIDKISRNRIDWHYMKIQNNGFWGSETVKVSQKLKRL